MSPAVDILFLAHKRPEFTRASLAALLANTDMEANLLCIYTDGEQENQGAKEALDARHGKTLIIQVELGKHGGPVACINDRLEKSSAEFIAKVDNDTIVPPGWLPACLDLMRRYRNVDLLGIEPWTPDAKLFPRWVEPRAEILDAPTFGLKLKNMQVRTPRPVSHIGGIGVFRRSAFERFGRPVPHSQDGRFGFTEWQWQNPGMVKAFIDPPLPVFLLDHLPFEPWRSLSRKYEQEGIQRNVGWEYDAVKHRALWDWAFASGARLGAEKIDVGGPRL